MTQGLYFTLPAADGDRIEWLLWDHNSRRRIDGGELESNKLGQLRELSQRCPTQALVPAACCSVFLVTLPASGKTARAALPFHLEEQLCCDPAELHIACPPLIAGQASLAVTVDRNIMQRWRELCDTAEIRVHSALPPACLLGEGAALFDGRWASWRSGDAVGHLDADALRAWLDTQQAPWQPESLWLTDGTEAPVQWQDAAVQTSDNVLQAVAQLAPTPADWSLFQNEFALSSPIGRWFQTLRWPAAVAATALLLHWAGLAIAAMAATDAHDTLRAEILAVYKEAFPEEQRVPRPKRQMQAHLDTLETDADSLLLHWLADTSRVIQTHGGEVSSIHYRHSLEQLRLQLRVPNLDTLNRLTAALEQAGHGVQRGSFSQQDGALSGDLLLQVGAS